MESLRFRIQPVYSQYHPEPTQQIGSTRLLRHQVETLEAFNDPNIDVIFNTAMTGDGKSLAAYLPALEKQKKVIAMYPTNELIQDQFYALSKYQHDMTHRLPSYTTMYSDKITQLMKECEQTVRMETIRDILIQNEIVLTNPDLIHLMMSHQYGWGYQRKELPITIGAFFNYFMFDEFHIFGVPQIIAVMNMLAYLATNYEGSQANRKKYIFLSATPNALMDRLLERSGLRYTRITGKYSSSGQTDSYRKILQPCELHLHEVSQTTPTETWIEEHLEEMHRFFEQYPTSKAAILVSSVATARRLYARLQAYFEPYSITVGENTGLTSPEKRRDSLQKQLLVATSTVDIGVDFHINYLIFEAFSAGSFLQRFGRLGRHDEFSTYRAHALMPRFVLERLGNKLRTEGELEREAFNTTIQEAFPIEQAFAGYTRLWGVVQAAQVIVELEQSKDENTAFTSALKARYERLYGGTVEKPIMKKAVGKYWRASKQYPEILDELQSFRGQSPLSCGVWDTDDHLQTYDLFFLLTNTEFEVIDESIFLQEVKKRGLPERDFQKQLLYLKISRYVPERLQLILGTPHDLSEPLASASLNHAQVLNMFSVREPYHTWRDRVNKRLKSLKLTCTLSDMKRDELKQRLQLSSLFPVYRLQDKRGDEYSIVFGQEALLLDSLLWFREAGSDKAIMA